MARFARYVRRSRRARYVLLTLVGLTALLLLNFQERTEAGNYTSPMYTNAAPGGLNPVQSNRDNAVYPISGVEDPCIAYMVVVDVTSGAAIADFSIYQTNGLGGLNSASLVTNSMVSGSTQFGCSPAIPSWETTVQAINGGAMVHVRRRGRVDTFTFNGAGYTPPPGLFENLALVNGTYRLTNRHGAQTVFNTAGMPATETDENGNTTTFVYDAQNRIQSMTDDRGRVTTFTHNGSGHVTSLVSDGKTWSFGYDGSGHLTTITTPGTQDQPGGSRLTLSYDGQGRLVSIDGWDGDDPWGDPNNPPEPIEPPPLEGGGGGGGGAPPPPPGPGKHTIAYVGATNQVASVTFGDCTTSFSYAAGVTTVTDPRGNVHKYHYTGNKITKTETIVGGAPKYVTRYAYSGELVSSIVYPRGNRIDFSWDNAGNLLQRRHKEQDTAQSSPTDLLHVWTYDANSFATSYTNPLGRAWTYTRDGAGNLTQVTNPTVTVPANQATTRAYEYNAKGLRTKFTDEEGNVTSYAYYASGNGKDLLEKITVDPGGLDLETTFTYDAAGNVATITDPNGHVYNFTWDARFRLIEQKAPAPLNYRIKYALDPRGKVVFQDVENIDKDGNVDQANPWIRTEFAWSDRYNLVWLREEIDATTTRTTTFEYDCNNNRIRVTKPEGNKEKWEYNEKDWVTKHIRGEGATDASTVEFGYDENGNRTQTTDGRGNDTDFTYDLFDRRTKTTNALDHYTKWSWDKAGNVTKIQKFNSGDQELQRLDLLYDERNRRWKQSSLFKEPTQTLPDAVTTWERLGTGHVAKRTSPSGSVTNYEYDAALRRTKVTDPMGNFGDYTFDSNGNITAIAFTETDGTNTVTHDYEAAYDELNRRTEWVEVDRTSASNRLVTQFSWDSRSNLVFRVDAMGNPIRWTFDGLNRMVTRERALTLGATVNDFTAAQVTQWEFDGNNRIVTHKDDGTNASSWEYDALDRPTKMTFPDGKTVAYVYDAADNVTKTTDPAGNVVDDVFDALNRNTSRAVTRATGFLGTTAETRTYDALNRMSTNQDDDYKLEYTYAVIGLHSYVATETQSYVGGAPQSLTFTKTYDNRGNIVTEVYPAGCNLALALSYNGNSQLTSISDGTNTIASYTYLGLRRKGIVFQNGATQTNTFTGFRNEVASIHHQTSGQGTIVQLDYGYNKVHDRTYERFGGAGATGDAFQYDRLRRLVRAWQGSTNPANPTGAAHTRTIDYNVDDDGNRTSVVVTPYQAAPATVSYTTNNLNQYTAVGATVPIHDANGNLTDNGAYTFEYDYRNQIVRVRNKAGGAVVADYRYDALGRRVEKAVGTVKERYFLCTRNSGNDVGNLANVMATYDGAGSWLQSFVHHGEVDDIAMLEQRDGLDYDGDGNTSEVTRSFYHLNALGSVMEITDMNEATVASYRYDPYGTMTITRGGAVQATDPLGQHWGFTGRFYDEESKLWYYRARTYDATTGRFMQRDPLGYSEGPSLFEYVGSSPVNGTDPSGLADGHGFTQEQWAAYEAYGEGLNDAVEEYAAAVEKARAKLMRRIGRAVEAYYDNMNTWGKCAPQLPWDAIRDFIFGLLKSVGEEPPARLAKAATDAIPALVAGTKEAKRHADDLEENLTSAFSDYAEERGEAEREMEEEEARLDATYGPIING